MRSSGDSSEPYATALLSTATCCVSGVTLTLTGTNGVIACFMSSLSFLSRLLYKADTSFGVVESAVPALPMATFPRTWIGVFRSSDFIKLAVSMAIPEFDSLYLLIGFCCSMTTSSSCNGNGKCRWRFFFGSCIYCYSFLSCCSSFCF